jgi:hypothetical protein
MIRRIVRTSPAVTTVIVARRIIGAVTTGNPAVIVTRGIISSLAASYAAIVVAGRIIGTRTAQPGGIADGIVQAILSYARGCRLEGGIAGAGAEHQRGNQGKSKGTTAHDITPKS